jgi:hypothetical protein
MFIARGLLWAWITTEAVSLPFLIDLDKYKFSAKHSSRMPSIVSACLSDEMRDYE